MPQSVLVRRGWRSTLLIIGLLLPGVALYALFVLAPLVQAAVFSLFDWSGFGPLTDFVGGDNYARVVTDGRFGDALTHNLLAIAVSTIFQIPLAILIANLLTGKFAGRALFRVVFFIPYIISEVVAGVLWSLLLAPSGSINSLLESAGAGWLAQPWLAQPETVMSAILVVIVWKFFGFYVILFLAALQGVPAEHYEAAVLDGANRWQVFRNITLPAIGSTIRIAIFLAVIGSLQLFDLVWVMTKGGPVGASSTMVTYMINTGLQNYEYGYASAVAVVIAIISFAVAILYQRFVLARDNEADTRYAEGRS